MYRIWPMEATLADTSASQKTGRTGYSPVRPVMHCVSLTQSVCASQETHHSLIAHQILFGVQIEDGR